MYIRHSKSKGFTLIELLVVIGIIGMLATVVYASLSEARARSRDNARISDLKQIELAMALYREANPTYPVAPSPGLIALSPTFLPTIPTDPQTGSAYSYSTHSGGNYTVVAILESHGTGATCYVKSRDLTGSALAAAVPSGSVPCENL